MVGIDKIGKQTGAGDGGFLVTDQDLPDGVAFDFILSNYNIDGNVLKREHKQLLDQHIVSFLRVNRFHVELTGTASRTGDAAYNRQLSRERVDRVRQYLLSRGLGASQVPLKDMKAVGEDKSTSKFDEDELERSVRIRMAIGVRPVPVLPNVVVPRIVPPNGLPPVPRPQEPPKVVDTTVPWQIMEMSGFNFGPSLGASAIFASIGVQAGIVEYHFLLVNTRTRQMAQCRFVGPAVSGGIGPAPAKKPSIGPGFGISMTQGSHRWDSFRTKAGTTFDDFAGTAQWTEPAGLGLGTDLSVKALLKFHGVGATARVSTGHTIGSPGALTSLGNFHLKPPVQLQI